MRLTVFSNYLNSHQLPLAKEFDSAEGVKFTFVSLLKTDGAVGRDSLDRDYPFVLREYEDASASEAAMRHAVEDDVVIFGDMAGKEQFVRARATTGKLSFRYAERLLKRGDWWQFVPLKRIRTWNMFTRYKDQNMYVLCASAFTARDLELFGFPKDRCFKWGYFPEIRQSCGTSSPSRDKAICSVQRLIPWKRVDLQIEALKRLIFDGYDVSLYIAGDGPERCRLEKRAKELSVSDKVIFTGQLNRSGVSELMEQSRIFLATSNRKEGWGATLNEAMASGCCVVASDAMGSAPFLIDDGVNGLLYKDSDLLDLYSKLCFLLKNVESVANLGKNAEKTIACIWNSRIAAARFLDACFFFLQNGYFDEIHTDGPMSRADYGAGSFESGTMRMD